MAEEDVALAAIRIKADGIEVLDIVDSKYKNLGSTMAKGKKRAEGNAEAMEKLRQASEKSAKSTQNNSVKNIESLMIMEAATSATNQLISARYKEIDSKLASGEITAEEAEELRNAAAAAVNVYTAATIKNTKAVAANTAALLANPFVFVTLGLVGLAMVLKGASKEFGLLADQLEFVGEKLKPVTESIDALVEGLDTVIGTDIANNKIFEALITE